MIYKLYIQPDDIFDSFVHISPNNRISSGGNVCPKNIDIAWAIAITSPQKFDHRSSQSVAIRVVLQSNVNVNKGFRVHSMGGASCDCQKTESNSYNELEISFWIYIILSLLSQMRAPIIIWTSDNQWFVEMCTDPLKEIFLQIFRMTITATKRKEVCV